MTPETVQMDAPGQARSLCGANHDFGRSAEFYVMMKLLRWGYRVVDAGHGHMFDLLVYKPGHPFKRVQVKASRSVEIDPRKKRTTAYRFSTGRGVGSKTGYSAEDIDVLALFAQDIERVVFRPVDGKTTLRVSITGFLEENAKETAERIFGF